MRVLLSRSNLVSTGWKLTDTPLGTFAERDDREGEVTLFLRGAGDALEYTSPGVETFSDGRSVAHLFDVLKDSGTSYKVIL